MGSIDMTKVVWMVNVFTVPVVFSPSYAVVAWIRCFWRGLVVNFVGWVTTFWLDTHWMVVLPVHSPRVEHPAVKVLTVMTLFFALCWRCLCRVESFTINPLLDDCAPHLEPTCRPLFCFFWWFWSWCHQVFENESCDLVSRRSSSFIVSNTCELRMNRREKISGWFA